MKINSQKYHGITLVEVVISMLILGISVAGLLQGYNVGYKMAINSKYEVIYRARALDYLEKIKSMPYDMITPANLTSKYEVDLGDGSGPQIYTETESVDKLWILTNSIETISYPEYKKINIVSIWERFGVKHTKQFFTIRAR